MNVWMKALGLLVNVILDKSFNTNEFVNNIQNKITYK